MDVKKSIFRGSWGNTHNSHVQQTLLSNLITKNKSVILPIKIVFGNNQQKNNKLLFSKENGEFKPYISINDASLRGKNSSLEINAFTGETSLIDNNSTTTVPSRIINAVLSTSPQTGETLELKIANTLVLSIQLAALRAKASQFQQAQVPGEQPVEALRDKSAIQKLSLVPPITEETNP